MSAEVVADIYNYPGIQFKTLKLLTMWAKKSRRQNMKQHRIGWLWNNSRCQSIPIHGCAWPGAWEMQQRQP